jgi:hypothetical protein
MQSDTGEELTERAARTCNSSRICAADGFATGLRRDALEIELHRRRDLRDEPDRDRLLLGRGRIVGGANLSHPHG